MNTPSVASQYLELTKPRVVSLIVFTAVIGMFLAVPGMVPLRPLIAGTIGIALLLQVSLGIANVKLGLPLPIATAHNGVAAVLLLALLALLVRVRAVAR